MTNDKLNAIIDQKNEQLERQAISRASQIIDEIAEEQRIISRAQLSISELRAELVALEVKQISHASILG